MELRTPSMLICVRRKVKPFKVNYLKRMTNQIIFFQLLCDLHTLMLLNYPLHYYLHMHISVHLHTLMLLNYSLHYYLHMHISVAFYEANKGNLKINFTPVSLS